MIIYQLAHLERYIMWSNNSSEFCVVECELNAHLEREAVAENLADYREKQDTEYESIILSGDTVVINKKEFSYDEDVLQNMVESGETLRLDLAEMTGKLQEGEREEAIQKVLDELLEEITDAHIAQQKEN